MRELIEIFFVILWIVLALWFFLAVILELRNQKKMGRNSNLMKFLRDKAKPQEAR